MANLKQRPAKMSGLPNRAHISKRFGHAGNMQLPHIEWDGSFVQCAGSLSFPPYAGASHALLSYWCINTTSSFHN